jgi:hypothetical protein
MRTNSDDHQIDGRRIRGDHARRALTELLVDKIIIASH